MPAMLLVPCLFQLTMAADIMRAEPLAPTGTHSRSHHTPAHRARHEHGHAPAHGHAATHSLSERGNTRVSVEMLNSGALHLEKIDAAGHASRQSRSSHHEVHTKPSKAVPASLARREGFDPQKFYNSPLTAAAKFFDMDDKPGPNAEHDKQTASGADDTLDKKAADHKAADQNGFEERDDSVWRAKDRGYAWKQSHGSRDETNDDDWDDEDPKQTGNFQEPVGGDGDGDNATDDGILGDDSGAYDDTAYDTGSMPMVNVTSEEDATAAPNKGPLKAADGYKVSVLPVETDVEKLGEGIGAMAYERSPTGSRVINHDLRQRLQIQDWATINLLVSVFALTVMLSCCSVYQVADDPSPAAYYSEPKNYQQRLICETNDVDAFLAAFNTQPQNVRLRIIGRNPEPGGFRRYLRNLNAHATRSRGLANLLPMRQRRRLSVLFDVALDLTPFITGDGRLSDENLMILQKYLNTKNRLETVLLKKKVDWALWEDVATNIRQRLRTLGFPGDVEVRFEASDEVLIFQNDKWSNFVRNRVTQALVAISIVGSAFWVPYVWVRSKTTVVETRFRINVDPVRYWELVAEGLSAAEGFQNM